MQLLIREISTSTFCRIAPYASIDISDSVSAPSNAALFWSLIIVVAVGLFPPHGRSCRNIHLRRQCYIDTTRPLLMNRVSCRSIAEGGMRLCSPVWWGFPWELHSPPRIVLTPRQRLQSTHNTKKKQLGRHGMIQIQSYG